jgi:hypothetical protein
MSDISYEFLRSFINAIPFIVSGFVILLLMRGPFFRFIMRNLLDSGGDRYNLNSKNNKLNMEESVDGQGVSEEKLKFHIRKILLNEGGQKYFDAYKDNLDKLIEQRQIELANYALSNVYSEEQIEETIAESLHNKVESTAKKLIRENKQFKLLEKETIDRLNLIKVSSFLEHLEKEYDATRSTKALMSNMFILVNVIYFFGLLVFLIFSKSTVNTPIIYLSLSFSYIGLGAFVVYMIKFCNARSLTLLSLREDFLKREQISRMAEKMVELGTSEHHVALLQLMNSSVATKEQKINHPYEMFLYGIKDSNIMFKGGKFEIKKEATGKINP